jgi:hypothetical protein
MLLKIGLWFATTLLTVIVIVSEALPPLPSLTVNVTVWLPASLLPGVQLNVLPDNDEPEGLPDTA